MKCAYTNKHGSPCGNSAIRKGRCGFHQTEQMIENLKAKLVRNDIERKAIVEEMQRIHNESEGEQ